MPAPRRSLPPYGVALALLVAVVLATQVVRLVEPLGFEQGVGACLGRWAARGWLPYRDLFDQHPPLYVYWWTLASAVPGDPARAAWCLEGLWLAGTLALVARIGARVWGKWEGLAAAALLFVALASPAWGAFASRARPEELLALPMLGSAYLAWRALDRASLALGAGILAGVAGLFALPSLALLLAWTVTWLACVPTRGTIARVGLALAGALAAWALAFTWFAAHGASSSFVEAVFTYPRHRAALPAPGWGSVLGVLGATLVGDAPLLAVTAAIGVLRLVRRGAREAHWVGSWIMATLAAAVLERPQDAGPYLLVMPALAVAGAYGVVDIVKTARAPDARLLAKAGLAALGILLARDLAIASAAYAPDLDHLRGRSSREAYLAMIQRGGTPVASEEEAARWLRDHTAPGDGIFVWGRSPAIYALADRHPVTRFALHSVLLTDVPASRAWPGLDQRRTRFLEDLAREAPAYVLVAQGDSDGRQALDSYTAMTRFRELRATLQRDYAPEGTIDGFVVYRNGRAR